MGVNRNELLVQKSDLSLTNARRRYDDGYVVEVALDMSGTEMDLPCGCVEEGFSQSFPEASVTFHVSYNCLFLFLCHIDVSFFSFRKTRPMSYNDSSIFYPLPNE